jgi:hypothetical protein
VGHGENSVVTAKRKNEKLGIIQYKYTTRLRKLTGNSDPVDHNVHLNQLKDQDKIIVSLIRFPTNLFLRGKTALAKFNTKLPIK